MTSARSIFVAPFDMRDKADEARRHLAVAFSDHLTGVAAFDEWRRQKATRSEFKWARANFCGAQTLKAIEQSREQFASHLQSIGFIGPGRAALREALDGDAGLEPDGKRTHRRAGAADADASAKSVALLKALLCAGLYPNVLLAPKELPLLGRKHDPPPEQSAADGLAFFAPSSKKKTAGEVAFSRCDPDVDRVLRESRERRERRDEGRGGRDRRRDDDRKPDVADDAAFLHPCCLDFDATALDHRCVVYREIVRTAKVYVRDATTVAPLALILFGGALTVHHERSVISVDEKIHFAAPPKVATLVKILRDEMESLLLRKIVKPGEAVTDREVAFVSATRAILGAEAVSDQTLRESHEGATFAPKGAKPKKKAEPRKPPPRGVSRADDDARDAPAAADADALDYALNVDIRDDRAPSNKGASSSSTKGPRGARGKGGRGRGAGGRGGGRRVSRLQ